MNNKRILIVGVLAVIVTLMVGYALFSETITINGTATAKGDFSITTTCQTGITESGILEAYGLSDDYKDAGYDNDSCSVNGNNVSYSVNLKYPGAKRFFTISMKNTGSIDAVAQTNDITSFNDLTMNIEVRSNSDNSLVKNITYSQVNGEDTSNLTEEDEKYVTLFEENMGALPAIKTSTGELIIEDSDEWQNRLYDATTKENDNFVYLKLEPNDTLILVAIASWNSDDDVTGYNYKVATSLKQPFKQMTSDMFLNTELSTCYTGC